MNNASFINKPPSPSFLEVMALILQLKSIFQKNENRVINLILVKAKQIKGIQLP